MMKTSLFALFAIIAVVAGDQLTQKAVSEARSNSQLEYKLAPGLPPAAQAIMNRLAYLANQVAEFTQRNNVRGTIPIWNEGIQLIKRLLAALTDETQKQVVEHLLSPWMNVFRQIVIQTGGNSDVVNTYYTEKNAILNALVAIEKGVTDNEAEKNSKLEADIAKGLNPAAADILNKLSAIAAEIGQYWESDDIEATIAPWEKAVTLIEALPSKLDDWHEKVVVKYLMTPWMKAFLKLLKSGKGTKQDITVYYTEKNAILEALETLVKKHTS